MSSPAGPTLAFLKATVGEGDRALGHGGEEAVSGSVDGLREGGDAGLLVADLDGAVAIEVAIDCVVGDQVIERGAVGLLASEEATDAPARSFHGASPVVLM